MTLLPELMFRFACSPSQIGSDEEEIRDAAKQIAEKKALLKKLSQSKNTLKNRPVLPRKTQHVSLKQFTTGMKQIGLDPKHLEKRAEKLVAKEKEAYEAFKAQNGADEQDGMDVDEEAAGPSAGTSRYTGRSRAIAERRAPRTDRRTGGLTTSTVSQTDPLSTDKRMQMTDLVRLASIANRQGRRARASWTKACCIVWTCW